MIKIEIYSNKIIINGHANYAKYGNDIVCAAVSSIVITSINACIRLDETYLGFLEEKDKLTIKINHDNDTCALIIENMLDLLEELALNYQKNIEIRRK